MVAAYASASAWRPTSRALGALFAGSAVMFGAAVLHGGSLLAPEDVVRPAAEPLVAGTGAMHSPGPATVSGARSVPAAPNSAPGQATPWTPGATPDWGTPVRELPLRRAPVQQAPQHGGDAPSTAEGASQPNAGFSGSGSRGAPAAPAEQGDDGVVDDMLQYVGKGVDF